jgi:hypothetical protein
MVARHVSGLGDAVGETSRCSGALPVSDPSVPTFSLFQQREERRYVFDDDAAVEATSLDKLPKLFAVCRCWIIQYTTRVR